MFKLPSVVLKKIVNLQRNFLWSWGSEGRKIAWPFWDKVCESREASELGIINIKLCSLALLSNWISQLGTNKGGLWKEVLHSKYGGWRSLKKVGLHNKDSLWWRDLKAIWKLEDWGRNFEDCFVWDVGNGKSKDKWVGNEALKSIFSRLFSLSVSKEASLECCGTWVNNG